MNAKAVEINPEFLPLMRALLAPGRPNLAADGPAAARIEYSAVTSKTGPDVATVRDIQAGGVRAREYLPESADATIVFYHGGGWVVGSVDDYDGFCRTLANASRMRVLSVEYRLAPEHPFPAGADDAWEFLRAVEPLGPLFVVGDSAGGNLSAVMAQLARDAGGPRIAGQVLIYPPLAGDPPSVGMQDVPEAIQRASKDIAAYYDHTIPASRRRDPRFAPAFGELQGLPPALIVTASTDVLAPEAVEYAGSLLKAGVEVRLHMEVGAPHGFMTLAPETRAAQTALKEICRFLDARRR
ncbi:alpha/beta hydrolase [Achromobacter anxifer]